jgi:hypothetical protein
MRKLRYCWDCRDWYIRISPEPRCECKWRDDMTCVSWVAGVYFAYL